MTDEEITRKFGVRPGEPGWEAAKGLAHNRVDRIICSLPDLECPHCGHEFTACFEDVRHGREIPCPGCERIIWIECIDEPEDEDGDEPVLITLTTEDTMEADE